MMPSEGVCWSCHKGATLNCTGLCSACAQFDRRAPKPRKATISPEELATVLAALTFWRQCRLDDAENRPPLIHQIATQGGALPNLTPDKVKLLIDRLDGAEEITVKCYEERWTGTKCSLCGEPQFASPGGATCANGHGGAAPLTPGEVPSLHKVQYRDA